MPLMTDRIKEFLARNHDDGPRLVVDLDVVRENYLGFASALPDTRVFYAVKANPAPEILDLLAGLGSCFDTASVGEIEQALAAGATSFQEPTDQPYGDRNAGVKDAFGNKWYIATHVKDVTM